MKRRQSERRTGVEVRGGNGGERTLELRRVETSRRCKVEGIVTVTPTEAENKIVLSQNSKKGPLAQHRNKRNWVGPIIIIIISLVFYFFNF